MSLEDKLKKIKQKEAEQEIDWQKTKETWLNDISYIFNEIKSWFGHLEKNELLEFMNLPKKTIHEDRIGSYEVPMLGIRIGDLKIVFEPIGTVLIGAWGRIDFYEQGRISDKYMIVKLKKEKGDFYWEIRSKRTPTIGEEFIKHNLEKYFENWLEL